MIRKRKKSDCVLKMFGEARRDMFLSMVAFVLINIFIPRQLVLFGDLLKYIYICMYIFFYWFTVVAIVFYKIIEKQNTQVKNVGKHKT